VSKYEWDPDKNATNILKHGVSFLEAESVLDSELSRVMVDAEHSDLEVRVLDNRLVQPGPTPARGNL